MQRCKDVVKSAGLQEREKLRCERMNSTNEETNLSYVQTTT
jgi:hypothetical protein